MAYASFAELLAAATSAETNLGEKKRELATLLDIDATEELALAMPEIPVHLDSASRVRLIANWENAAPIRKASFSPRAAFRALLRHISYWRCQSPKQQPKRVPTGPDRKCGAILQSRNNPH